MFSFGRLRISSHVRNGEKSTKDTRPSSADLGTCKSSSCRSSTTGGGLFANVESDDPGLPLPGIPFSSASQSKGLDSGLAKACPSTDNLNQKSYRSFRRRLELFQRQCSRRGREVAVGEKCLKSAK